MKILSIKVSIHGISPMVWRRIRVPSTTSIADFHQIIQTLFQWNNDHLHRFHIYGKDYGISYVGGIGFSDNPHEVTLDDFCFDAGDKLTYEYNFNEHWVHDIRVEAVEDITTSTCLAVCTRGNHMLGAGKFDELNAISNLLKAIANSDKESEFIDLSDEIEGVNAVKFNRKLINDRLAHSDQK